MSPNPVRIEKKPPITLISGFLSSGGVESNLCWLSVSAAYFFATLERVVCIVRGSSC
jgi:hypothetical protein